MLLSRSRFLASWISPIGNVFQDERLNNENYMEEMQCKSDQIQQKNIENLVLNLYTSPFPVLIRPGWVS